MAAMLLFKQKRCALQPIDWRRSRVAPLLCRCKIHNGAAAQCGGTSFTLFLCHPFQGVGEHEETVIPKEDWGVMWESSALLLWSNSCWYSLNSLTLFVQKICCLLYLLSVSLSLFGSTVWLHSEKHKLSLGSKRMIQIINPTMAVIVKKYQQSDVVKAFMSLLLWEGKACHCHFKRAGLCSNH